MDFQLNNYWIEKYRPTTLNDVIIPSEFKNKFEQYLSSSEIPHLLFTGPPGTGKTTVARIMTSSIASNKLDRLVINASNERGIDIVREKIVMFMRSAPISSKFKIIFLDEADYMTDEAFASLRNTIEDPTYNQHLKTRFILTSNYIMKIPEYIQSRMQVYQFSEPSEEEIYVRCKFILDTEGINYNEEDIKKIISLKHPDIRATIGLLQSSSIDGRITEIKSYSSIETMKEIIHNFFDAKTFDDAARFRLELRENFPDDIDCVNIMTYIMNEFSNNALIHSIAYRHSIVAFRAIDQKHAVLALLADYLLARYGYDN